MISTIFFVEEGIIYLNQEILLAQIGLMCVRYELIKFSILQIMTSSWAIINLTSWERSRGYELIFHLETKDLLFC